MQELKFVRQVQNDTEYNRTMRRISLEIVERAGGVDNLVLVGIYRRGVFMVRQMIDIIKQNYGDVQVGELDINLYNDDLTKNSDDAIIKGKSIGFSLDNKYVVLVDDVLYTGKTVNKALEAIRDCGSPRTIKLAVLVDRGWHQLPYDAEFVGIDMQTLKKEVVKVSCKDLDGKDGVDLYELIG